MNKHVSRAALTGNGSASAIVPILVIMLASVNRYTNALEGPPEDEVSGLDSFGIYMESKLDRSKRRFLLFRLTDEGPFITRSYMPTIDGNRVASLDSAFFSSRSWYLGVNFFLSPGDHLESTQSIVRIDFFPVTAGQSIAILDLRNGAAQQKVFQRNNLPLGRYETKKSVVFMFSVQDRGGLPSSVDDWEDFSLKDVAELIDEGLLRLDSGNDRPSVQALP